MTTATANTTTTVVKREIVALNEEEAGFVMERCVAARAITLISISPEQGESSVSLRVQSQGEPDLQYKIGVKLPLKFLMMDYCHRKGFGYGTLRFHFDGNRVRESQTPLELAMEEDDTIDAFSEQLGGSCC